VKVPPLVLKQRLLVVQKIESGKYAAFTILIKII